MRPTPQFVTLRDGDIIGLRHIVTITAVGGDNDRHYELILANGAKKKITEKEVQRIQSAMFYECLMLPWV